MVSLDLIHVVVRTYLSSRRRCPSTGKTSSRDLSSTPRRKKRRHQSSLSDALERAHSSGSCFLISGFAGMALPHHQEFAGAR